MQEITNKFASQVHDATPSGTYQETNQINSVNTRGGNKLTQA